jgi:hypothetical protein
VENASALYSDDVARKKSQLERLAAVMPGSLEDYMGRTERLPSIVQFFTAYTAPVARFVREMHKMHELFAALHKLLGRVRTVRNEVYVHPASMEVGWALFQTLSGLYVEAAAAVDAIAAAVVRSEWMTDSTGQWGELLPPGCQRRMEERIEQHLMDYGTQRTAF